MSIRDDLCAQRATAERLDRELAEIEQRLASRNAAHLISRARSMAQATGSIISDALRLPLEEAAPPADLWTDIAATRSAEASAL